MPYKNKKIQRKRSLENYYKNREMKIEYQREYDKKNKDKKALQDKKRYGTKKYNKIQNIRHYSQKHHLPKLLEKHKCCEICDFVGRLEIHHKRYTRKLSDCMLVCKDCHKKLHRKIQTSQ